jgi:iron(III) transport system permease protein
MTVAIIDPGALEHRRPVRRGLRTPRALAVTSVIVAAALLVPIVFLLVDAGQVGATTITNLVFRQLTLSLLWNTVRLAAVTTLLCAVIGTSAAWWVERTCLPGRRAWAVLIILPAAVPDFVIAYGWLSAAPWLTGYWGAVLVMTLGLYPLVYLPVAASFRAADPGQEEVARSLGLSPMAVFWRVTVRQARAGLLGGCLLVSLALLAEYGAFEMLRYQTFTTEIFTEFQIGFNAPAACALSLVLVLIGIAILSGEASLPDRGRTSRVGPLAARQTTRASLGRATVPVLLALTLLVGMALGVPVAMIVYWIVHGGVSTLPASTSLLSATLYTAAYSAAAAALAALLALPVALLAVRHRSPWSRLLERSTLLVQALPGVVVALALVFLGTNYLLPLYQTPPMLVVAYAILFFPLALIAVRATVARAPAGLEEIARSLGKRPLRARMQVTVPLIAPGLAAAFCLVFMASVTELTATLILVPTGVQTLATEFWAYTTNISYSAAAPYAGVMIALAVIPAMLVGRWFSRNRSSSETLVG